MIVAHFSYIYGPGVSEKYISITADSRRQPTPNDDKRLYWHHRQGELKNKISHFCHVVNGFRVD